MSREPLAVGMRCMWPVSAFGPPFAILVEISLQGHRLPKMSNGRGRTTEKEIGAHEGLALDPTGLYSLSVAP